MAAPRPLAISALPICAAVSRLVLGFPAGNSTTRCSMLECWMQPDKQIAAQAKVESKTVFIFKVPSSSTVYLGQSHWQKDKAKRPRLLFRSGYLPLRLASRKDKVGQNAHCARQSHAASPQAPEIISGT